MTQGFHWNCRSSNRRIALRIFCPCVESSDYASAKIHQSNIGAHGLSAEKIFDSGNPTFHRAFETEEATRNVCHFPPCRRPEFGVFPA